MSALSAPQRGVYNTREADTLHWAMPCAAISSFFCKFTAECASERIVKIGICDKKL